MATKRYSVTDSVLGESVDFGDGKMDKYLLTLKGEDGAVVSEVQQWRQSGQPGFLAGDTIEGEVVSQPRGGVKLKGGRKVDASAPAPASGGSSPSGGRTDATGRSIERQVALKVAGEYGAALVAAGKDVPPAKVVEAAGIFDAFLSGSKPAGEKDGDDIPF